MVFKVNDELPSVELYENSPDGKVNIADFCRGKKVVIFGVPGAFTPTCSKSHLPGFVEKYDELKSKGIDAIICISVNDPFVMGAWGESSHATNKVVMLADPRAEFTKAINMELDLTAVLGNVRSKRYSMYVDNKVVKNLNVEPDGTGLTCSKADSVLQQL